MKELLLALALLLPAPASATWSTIAMDRTTGRVAISSATCAAQGPNQLKLLQAIVLPGISVAAATAGVDRTQANHPVQGNIIASKEALTEAPRIMQESDLDMIERVMVAMEKADELGGDSCCTCQTEPLPGAQCTGKTSHVAHISAANADDPPGTFHVTHPEMRAPYNNGDYHLYLAVWPANTEPDEDANPVRTLRMRYETWKAQQGY